MRITVAVAPADIVIVALAGGRLLFLDLPLWNYNDGRVTPFDHHGPEFHTKLRTSPSGLVFGRRAEPRVLNAGGADSLGASL